MELLTSSCMLPLLIAASCFTYFFSIHELNHIFGGSNCSVAVDKLVSPLLLCLGEGVIRCSAHRSPWFRLNPSGLYWLWSQDLMMGKM
jgi:hypothetical protein